MTQPINKSKPQVRREITIIALTQTIYSGTKLSIEERNLGQPSAYSLDIGGVERSEDEIINERRVIMAIPKIVPTESNQHKSFKV
jgi:hypothetical protein